MFSRARLRCTYLALSSRGAISFGPGSKIGRGAILTTGGGSIKAGRNTIIEPGAMIMAYGGDVVLGDHCSVNPYSVLYGHGGLTIGNLVRIAAHTVIIPANHNFEDITRPIKHQGVTMEGITIEDDVWIGANVTILDGAYISRGCVIAAGAVVRGPTEPFGLYGGVPARLIRSRGEELATVAM